MNPHADTARAAAHRAARESLPWLLNGSLGGEEREAVQLHLQSCAACRDELAQLQALKLAAHDGAVPVIDPERALARILPRLDARPVPKPQPPGLLRRWRARLAANERAWLRGAMVAQAAVIAGLLLALARPGAVDTAPYRVLGAHAQEHVALVVVFKPQTTEAELRRIARASGVRIVDGPTVTDAYLVSAHGSAAAALARLRAEPSVALAEPLAPEGRP